MVDLKIGNETYGLILITSNVSDFFFETDDHNNKIIVDDLLDIFKFEYQNINEYKGKYLFYWDEIIGNDSKKLIRFLINDYGIEWLKTDKIKKFENGNCIKLTVQNNNHVSMEICEDRRSAILRINDEKTNEFIVRNVNGRLKIFKTMYEYINSWTLLGIHDLAILIKSESKLDQAIIDIGNKLVQFNEINIIKIRPPNWLILKENKKIRESYERIITQSSLKEKYIEIFDFWCEPMIPFYIGNSIKINKNNIILYLRLNTTKNFNFYNILSKLQARCNEKSIGELLAIFNGFGIFDLILIIGFSSHFNISQILNNIRSCFEGSLYDSCSLICSPYQINIDTTEKIPFSINIKINALAEKMCVWNEIKSIANEIGISEICIEKIGGHAIDITYKQGFYDFIFIGHGTLQHFSMFCRLLESFPFIIDTSTNLNLNINCSNLESDS